MMEGRPVPLLAVNHVLFLMKIIPLLVLEAGLLILTQHVLRLQLLGAAYLHALDDHAVSVLLEIHTLLVGSQLFLFVL
jgi:hypothetical protein